MVPVSSLDPAIASRLKRDANGLVTAVIQDADSRDVLMVGWMDDEEPEADRDLGGVEQLAREGDQAVREVRLDCDGDTLLVLVDQTGPACHTGDRTCFDSDRLL